ncbi:hypothetical protein BKA67DRAFT_633865 [Truncatella angustata]|uniref:Glutathione S-transferase n=1 Tax=Truncatella angustata TaxID=152316 RepID=A0A9P8UWE8_9PEZI|nr:uncharacterized protein BKA67DRAFT_633865 [Truncatella angustata]KAH6659423.1 hypothetical protein BKA67DRAFT_633865 [Truncatella angustata]
MEVSSTFRLPVRLTESKSIHLLTENMPNGKKVQILLEELRLASRLCWEMHLINLETDEQKKTWFLRLDPNGSLLLVYIAVSVMDSSAILLYIQEHYDSDDHFGFNSAEEKSQVLQWLFFWHAAVPIQGQTRHFNGKPAEPSPWKGIGKYSIADIGTWPHVRAYKSLGSTEEDMRLFPNLLGWISRIAARPAVQAGTCEKYDSEDNHSIVVRTN